MVTSIRSLPDGAEVEVSPGVPGAETGVAGAFMGCDLHDRFGPALLQALFLLLSHCDSIRKNLVTVEAVASVDGPHVKQLNSLAAMRLEVLPMVL
jgi:hypothetical protein